MLQIYINGILFNLGQPLPETITSLEIIYQALIPIQYPLDQDKAIKSWFNQLIDKCTCEYASYNHTLCRVDELTKFDL